MKGKAGIVSSPRWSIIGPNALPKNDEVYTAASDNFS